MADTVIIPFIRWYMERGEDWNCDHDCMVFMPDGTRTIHAYNCQADQDRVREMNPGAVVISEDLSIHRGKSEGAGLEVLRTQFPAYYDAIIAVHPRRFPLTQNQ